MRGRIITDIMPLIDQVQQEMVAAMKSGDAARLSALRMLKAALMKLKVDSPKPIDEAAEMGVLKILIKQRTDAAEMFRKADRIESALVQSTASTPGPDRQERAGPTPALRPTTAWRA